MPQRIISKTTKVNAILIIAQLLLVYSIIAKWLEFGCRKGNWVYPYSVKDIDAPPFILFLVLTPIILILVHLSLRLIEKQKGELPLLFFWLFMGVVFQNAFRIFYPFSLHDIITSDAANSFYSPTLNYSPYEFLKNFHTLIPLLPLHVRTNMPGKVLFYYFLKSITDDPQIMGYIIMLFSNAGGLFLYFITKKLLGGKEAAFQAFILYLFIPAKIFFLPILNTVSPFFILSDFFLFLIFLENQKKRFAFILGVLLYVTFLFEPLPMGSGILFIGLLLNNLIRREIDLREIIGMVLYVILGFLSLYFLVYIFFGLDTMKAFIYILKDLQDFFVRARREYTIWIFHNLKEFIVTAGFSLSLLFLFNISCLFSYKKGELKGIDRGGQPQPVSGDFVTVSFLFLLIIIDLLGMNRGEVTRLWIFMASFLPIIAVDYLSKLDGKSPFYVCLGGLFLQIVVSISLVGFVIP